MSWAKRALVVFLFVGLIFGGSYLVLGRLGFLEALQTAFEIRKQEMLTQEDKRILEQLKAIMVLPDDIQPSMAIINDVELLKAQNPVLFGKAKNGDRLFMYPDQVIIFDAEAGKIVKVASVAPASVEPVAFAVYNATGDESRVAAMEQKLETAFTNVEVTVREDAAGTDYSGVLVVDLIGNGNPEINRIAEAVGGTVAELPEGEVKPENVAVLIIIGQ